jgi:hypothetical protein
MWKKAILLGVGLLVGTLSVSALSGEPPQKGDELATPFAPVDKMASMIKKLIRATDLWHDANLKGDHARIVKSERVIFDVIQADIGFSRENLKKVSHIADSVGTVVYQEKVKQSAGMLRAKERLVNSLRRAKAFSNKYRLLGDYIDLLKIERRANSVELVEQGDRVATDSDEGER